MRWFLVALVLALGGCAERNARIDDDACRSYGAIPGTDAYINCRAQMNTARAIAAQ
jgi:hypothetical protein